MNKLEQLKAAYEAVPKATWVYDEGVSAVIYADKYTLKCAADLGKIDNSDPLGEFIALAHNMMPLLLEAADIADQWGNARTDDQGGHALRNYAARIRNMAAELERKNG